MKKSMLILAVCVLAVIFCLSPAGKGASAEAASRPKPTVRPLEIRYDHTLPGVKLSVENVQDYFTIKLGKEYNRGQYLTVPCTVTPKGAYDVYDGTTPRVVIRIQLNVFLTEDAEEPYYTKTGTILLWRKTGLKTTDSFQVLLRLDQDEIWYTWEIIGVNGPAEEEVPEGLEESAPPEAE